MNYCKFLRKFFDDDRNITDLLDTSLARCSQLNTFYADERILFAKSEMPLTYPNIDEFIERREYWSQAEEYSLLLNEMHKLMWEKIKFAPDPKKPKKAVKKKKSETSEASEPNAPWFIKKYIYTCLFFSVNRTAAKKSKFLAIIFVFVLFSIYFLFLRKKEKKNCCIILICILNNKTKN